jgi:hypothetical protein
MEFKDWVNVLEEFALSSVGLSGTATAYNTLLRDTINSIPRKEDYKNLEEYNSALQTWKDKMQEISNSRFRLPMIEYDESGWSKWSIKLKEDVSSFFKDLKENITVFVGTMFLKSVDSVEDFVKNTKNKFSEWKKDISNKVEEIRKYISDKFKIIKTDVENAMKKASESFDNFKKAISNTIDKIKEFLGLSDKEFKLKLPEDVFDDFIKKIKESIDKLKEFFDFDGKSIEVSGEVSTASQVQGYATGGFPSKYSLFMAGENGIPEIAGTVGGRTAVAGGAEITGIKDAVYSTGQAEVSLLQTAVKLLEVIADKEFGITERAIGKAVQNQNRISVKRTGQSLIAT